MTDKILLLSSFGLYFIRYCNCNILSETQTLLAWTGR